MGVISLNCIIYMNLLELDPKAEPIEEYQNLQKKNTKMDDAERLNLISF